MQPVRWRKMDSIPEMTTQVAEAICRLANGFIREQGCFTIVLAGGNTPRSIYQHLQQNRTDWSRWYIYFSDERCLPAGDPDRNDSMAYAALLDYVPVPPENIHAILAQLSTAQCLGDYTEALQHIREFDLVLLGLGEDGHTASLFPDHDWGASDSAPAVLAVDDAPKPPARRISLSANRLCKAKNVWFLVSGESKRDVLLRWQAGENIPAGAIQATGNPVEVFYNVSAGN